MSVLPDRIDAYPTHEFQGIRLRPGRPFPFGATLVPGGINFAIYSRHATACSLALFRRGESQPWVEIPFQGTFSQCGTGIPIANSFRIGHVFAITVFDIDYESVEYQFRFDGPGPRPTRGTPALHRFNPKQLVLDPYAKAVSGRDVWGSAKRLQPPYEDNPFRGRIVVDDFDWESDRQLEIPIEELVIYELHVRGFTRHPSSGVRHPGTFAGLREKIPYLRNLGVNCVELMPIFEFDELHNDKIDPRDGQRLWNYWGYDTIGFFAPKAAYAASGHARDGTMVADELKNLIKELHRQGIEVILDVVFNHTGEGNEFGPTISFRGIDNRTYYMLTPEGYYFNYSGTGNTMNCNHPLVRNLVLDCLRYWVAEYHVDGFRFDLAAILGRSHDGEPLANPPLLEALALDPVLARCKLIAEAWDAGGLYQVGRFPAYGRWAEWNGKYRDTIRQFLKGDAGQVPHMSQALLGSPNLYAERGPTASVNFLTCHDGFSLADLVSYDTKHNVSNGEDNRDGANDNHSWNCGREGPTDDPDIQALRLRQRKNAILMLMLSQGVPMLLMGDELGRTQFGNNNAWCHDSVANWLDWSAYRPESDFFRFVQLSIAFRRAHPALRSRAFASHGPAAGENEYSISWHGCRVGQPDWSHDSHSLAFHLHATTSIRPAPDDDIFVAINMYWDSLNFELPLLAAPRAWHVAANTGNGSPDDIAAPGFERPLQTPHHDVQLRARSVLVLIGREVLT